MKKFKIMLSIFMVLVIIAVSVAPVFAVVAPEDSVSNNLQWSEKINTMLLEKMEESADDEKIPVWVWMTDIDTDKLEKDIETQTGLTHQKIIEAKTELSYERVVNSTDAVSKTSLEKDSVSSDEDVHSYLNSTKAQRQKIADDTEKYFEAKKRLAKDQYTTTNTAKIRQLGVTENRIDFQSELTPSFIAYLTREEIVETAKSDVVLEMGYFYEYDEEYSVGESTQVQSLAVEEEPTESATLDVSTLHTGIKEAIQHDDALRKYGVTGKGIKVLHVDHGYVRSDKDNFYLLPYSEKIQNVIESKTYNVRDTDKIPIDEIRDDLQEGEADNSHANFCVSYLQAFCKDVQVFSVAKPSAYDDYNEIHGTNINTFNDIEYAITDLHIDLINASCNDAWYEYQFSFSSRWYDAIVSTYNIPLVASAGNVNTNGSYTFPIAPASGYNSIAVGVYVYSTNRMGDDYTFNPVDEENRVAYKPDLVVAMDWSGGTSAGAPIVSGIVAMMMELDPSLKGNPEIIKSILMASCHEKAIRSSVDEENNIEQEKMKYGLTLKQGAGKVNALRALNIVNFGTYGHVVVPANINGVNVQPFFLNSQVYGDSNETYPLNVSIAWLRKNTKASNNESDNNITLGTKHEFNLKVSYTNQDSSAVKVSETENSGKQLVFYENPDLDKNYIIRVYRDEKDVNDGKSAVCGYAYSVGNFEKMLDRVEITGVTAIGKTLTANANTVDELPADNEALDYIWYSSTDGESWQMISGVTSPTYTLTSSDVGKYFKCIVIQDYLNNCEVDVITQTKVVRYGDVDNDGAISVIDATMASQYAANIITLSEAQLISADVDGDGVISSNDSLLIQQYVMGSITSFPVENS